MHSRTPPQALTLSPSPWPPPPRRALDQSYDLDDSGYDRGAADPYGGSGAAQKVLSPTKARVARGLQDLLIDLKEMKADNRRLEDLLRQEQGERTK